MEERRPQFSEMSECDRHDESIARMRESSDMVVRVICLTIVYLLLATLLSSEEWTHFTCIEDPRAVVVDPYRSHLVWFATTGGLARYDKTEETWRVYTNSEGLSKIWCRSLMVDEDCLWVGTETEGANRFDLEAERFTPFVQDIINPYAPRRTVFCFANDGENLWLGTDTGALCVDKATLEIRREITTADGFNTNWVTSIAVDSDCIWFATTLEGGYIPEEPPESGGLSRFEKATATVETFRAGEGPYINWFRAMVNDGDCLWLGSKVGLFTFNKYALTFSHMLCDSIRSVYSLAVDSDTLWCGTYKNIVKIGKQPLDVLETYTPVDAYYGEVYALSIDDQHVWASVHGRINVIHKDRHTIESMDTPFLPAPTVYAIAHRDTILYAGARSNLVQINLQHMTVLNRDITQGALGPAISSTIKCLAFDGQYLWIGKHSGLKKFNLNSMEVEGSYFESPYSESAHILSIVNEDPFLWLGTHYGIASLDKRTGEQTFFRYPELEGPWSSDLLSDGDVLWIGSRSGLLRFNKTTHDLEQITDVAVEALSDDDPYVWLGCKQLNRIHKETLALTEYETPWDIRDLASSDGYLWACTHEGAFLFDTDEETVVKHYTEKGNMTHNWINDVHLTDGYAWFGSYAGLSAVALSSVDVEPIKGDVNGDWRLTVTDVVVMVNHILGYQELTSQQVRAADCNADGVINVLDVVALINEILFSP